MMEATASAMPESPFAADGSVRITGHRGAAGVFPENTVPSLEWAVRTGADALEVDLRATADDRLVLFHDPTVDRTTDGSGPLSGFTLEEARSLDAGHGFTPDDGQSHPYRGRGIRIPTLEEGLEAAGGLPVVVEVKEARAGRLLARWLERRRDGSGSSGADGLRVLVGGFSREAVAPAARRAPWCCASEDTLRPYVLLGKLGLGRLPPVRRFVSDVDALLVPERYRRVRVVSRRFVRRAHRDGLGVHVWTVNRPDRMRRLWELGVDGIISDFPGRARRIWEEITAGGGP